MGSKGSEKEKSKEVQHTTLNKLKKLFTILNVESGTEFYALYLTQNSDLDNLLKTIEFEREELVECIEIVQMVLGVDLINNLKKDFENLNNIDMPYGALKPEDMYPPETKNAPDNLPDVNLEEKFDTETNNSTPKPDVKDASELNSDETDNEADDKGF